jgi:anti-anti-sigma factor
VTVPHARIEAGRDDDAVTVSIVGEVDLGNAGELEREIVDATAGARAVVVDLSLVAYLDSRGIRMLVELVRRLRAEGVEPVLVAPTGSIASGVLRIVEIAELPVVEDVPAG